MWALRGRQLLHGTLRAPGGRIQEAGGALEDLRWKCTEEGSGQRGLRENNTPKIITKILPKKKNIGETHALQNSLLSKNNLIHSEVCLNFQYYMKPTRYIIKYQFYLFCDIVKITNILLTQNV